MKIFCWLFIAILGRSINAKHLRRDTEWKTVNNTIFLNDQPVRIKGITWNGFQTEKYVPLGLWRHSMEFYLDLLKQNHINAIRVPFSLEFTRDFGLMPDPASIKNDVEMTNRTSIEILDALFEKAFRKDILIVLNLNRLHKDFHSNAIMDDYYSEDDFLEAWYFLLDRYGHYKNMFGIDIYEEPGFPPTTHIQWRHFTEKFIDRIRARYPKKKWLFFIQGLNRNENFMDMNCSYPVSITNQIIFTPHIWDDQTESKSPISNLYEDWNRSFGHLGAQGKTVVISKMFTSTSFWMIFVKDYLIAQEFRNVFLFSLEHSDIYGILDEKWMSVRTDKMNLLEKIQPNATIKFSF